MTPYILNLLDLAFTLHATRHGGVELNPLMQCVPFMVAYKVVVVGALCWWVQKQATPAARIGLGALTVLYGAVDLWHIINIVACWAA